MNIILMKRKMKKVMALIFSMILTISMCSSVLARENPVNEMNNVSTEAPDDINNGECSSYGLSRPSKDKCVNLNDKSLSFSGYAEGSTLYTNSHFTGKSTIGYSITNDCDTKLTVKFYTSTGLFSSKKITVEANATLTGTISGLDADKMYYLTFSAPSDFSGSVY